MEDSDGNSNLRMIYICGTIIVAAAILYYLLGSSDTEDKVVPSKSDAKVVVNGGSGHVGKLHIQNLKNIGACVGSIGMVDSPDADVNFYKNEDPYTKCKE